MKNEKIKYEKAKKRMKEVQAFYSHLMVYIVMNIAILVFKIMLLPHFLDNLGVDLEKGNWGDWQRWDIMGTPVFWGIGLLGHAIWTFRRNIFGNSLFENSIFSKKWEEKKIKELMNDDNF